MNRASLVGHILELFELIDRSTQPPDRLTSDFFRARKYLGSHDRRSISEPVFGMIRHRRCIEALLEEFLAKHPDSDQLDQPHHRYLSLYVAYSSAIEHHAAEDHQQITPCVPDSFWQTYFPKYKQPVFIEWITRHKTLGFLNDDAIVRLGVRYSFQDWMVQELFEQTGEETEQLLGAFNSPAPITLRINERKISREDCRLRLHEEGIETTPTHISPFGLVAAKRFNQKAMQSFNDGLFEIQDEGSQLISLLLNPKPGDRIMDACAGAGGKSLHCADIMKDNGEIIAVDVDARRLSELQSRAERAGIHSIRTLMRENVQPENFIGKSDIVLVDAPCSGVGTIRRNPAFKWSVTESLVKHYTELQKSILEFNAPFVKAGGRLAYATCSLFRPENEDIVNDFLKTHGQFELLSHEKITPVPGLTFDERFIKLYPHKHNTDGFFVAIMRRRT